MQVTSYNPKAKLDRTSFGAYLAHLDRSLQTWTNLFLSGDRVRDARTLQGVALDISTRAGKLYSELIETLETGPPQNRRVAAAALGFVQSREALSPMNALLNALSDPDELVRSNALLGLAVLGDPKTPLGGISQKLQLGTTSAERCNAALALIEILRAGATGDDRLLALARAGLHDEEPLIRTQCALILAQMQDTSAIEDLALILYEDDVNTPAIAAARALAYLGSHDLHVKGRCARALTASLGMVNSTVKAAVTRDLRKLADKNYSEDEDWVTWSHRLD